MDRIFSLLFLLLFSLALQAQTVTRGPYLQMQTDDSIIVRWRTDIATDSVVRYGDAPTNLNFSETVGGLQTEHSVTLSGLGAAQQYFYSVGDSIGALAGDSSYHFHTAPVPGPAADTRIWVIGDSGTANQNALDVRNAYKAWSGSDPADLWLMLGDNAYNDGTDLEYQNAVFNIYPELLRQLPLWSTLGNHDGHMADSGTQSGPYYDIFDLPAAAEAGGLASGTEAYYSFDYGNIHFICLDSYDSSRSIGGAMLQWLEADLTINDKPWVIAFWHHPPYTKGSHNSDTEGRLIDMRQNALPILEAWGVDLVMTGHSHSYERSMLIDSHYGASGSFDPLLHALDSGDGRSGGSGAYEKPDAIAAQNAGAVYAVAGSSGKISGGALDHPAMFISLNSLGSLVLDVNGNQLDGTFIDQVGAVRDTFTILKTPDTAPPLLTGATAEDATHVRAEFSEALDPATATQAGNYSIAGLTVSTAELLTGDRSVRLTTSAMQDGSSYTLSVSNVEDVAGNVIAPGSTADYTYYDLMALSFQDGIAPTPAYSGTRDSYIREASPDSNYGLATSLQVDGDEPSSSGNDMNILLQWDVSDIPSGSIIETAEMVLEVTNVGGTYYCHGLQRAWVETETSWNSASSGTPWGTPGAESGGDRGTDTLCSINATSTGQLVVPLNADGVALVQGWVDNPAANHGIIISDTASGNGADFHSRQSGTAVARPRLDVIYRNGSTPPEFIDQFALADVSTNGSSSQTFAATHDDDGNSQVLTERESGGKKRDRTSLLEHVWRFSVAPGSAMTLHANAWSGGSSDGDSFIFAWSSDNASYQDLFTVSSTSQGNVQSGDIPASGTIYIQVRDSNRGAGNRARDSVFVDQLYIRSENGEPPPNQPPAASFSWTCSGLNCSFSDTSTDTDGTVVSWNWDFGDGSGSTDQHTGRNYAAPGDYSVILQVTDDDGDSDSYNETITVTAGSTISLAASGYKVRGAHYIDLTWSGATGTSVDIYRDGGLVTTTANDDSHTDVPGNKGGRSYVYRLCEAGLSNCSDEVTVVF